MAEAGGVLLLGANPYALRALRKERADVLCVAAPGAATEGVPTVRVTRSDDPSEVLSALARHGHAPSAVHTADEELIVPAAVLGASLGARATPVDVAIAMRDKAVQKRRVTAAGVRTARFGLAPVGEEARPDAGAVDARLSWPRVVKPLDGAATAGVAVVHDAGQLTEELRRRTRPGLAGEVLVEQFVDGQELHLDGFLSSGRLRWLSVARYLSPLRDLRSGRLAGSITLDRRVDAAEWDDAERLAEASLRALGYRSGPFHMEAFESAEGLTFGECGARVGGGYIGEMIWHKLGVDQHEDVARTLCGVALRETTVSDRTFGWTLLPLAPGRVRRVPSVDALLERPGVIRGRVDVAAGDEMADMRRDSATRAGMALSAGDDAASVRRSLDQIAAWFADNSEVDEL